MAVFREARGRKDSPWPCRPVEQGSSVATPFMFWAGSVVGTALCVVGSSAASLAPGADKQGSLSQEKTPPILQLLKPEGASQPSILVLSISKLTVSSSQKHAESIPLSPLC